MSYNTIKFIIDDRGIATISLNRPDKHNAMSGEMIAELAELAEKLHESVDIRAVVLTGVGKSFCAGGDLNWMKAQFDADRESRIAEATKLARMLKSLNELPQPMIAKVNGNAFGGGVGLMCCCDMVVADENALFGFTETRLGLIPATISPYVIARMGEGRARRVFMSAKRFGTDEAISLGLVSQITSAAELDSTIEQEVSFYLTTSPQAVAASKRLARYLGPSIDNDVIAETAKRLADTWETKDAQDGIGAFFEKRKPNWV